MKAIDQIIQEINASIVSGTGASIFAAKQVYGLTEIRKQRNGVEAPCTINNEGRVDPIFTNDKCPLLVYHRLNGTTYKNNTAASFGRGYIHAQEANVSLFVWAMRSRINMTSSELEQLLVGLIPREFDRSFFISKMALKSLNTTVVSCNHNTAAIYSKEWAGVESAIPTSAIMLEIRYIIGSTHKTDCLVNCCN